jgi:hypothetical protein
MPRRRWLATAESNLGSSRNALTPTEATEVFDLALPPAMLTWQSRKHGSLQVWRFEVLARLRTEDRAWFLSRNHLTSSQQALERDEQLEAELQKAGAPAGRPRLTHFPLPTRDTLERWLVLIEYDDQLWVWLDSMDLLRG